MDLNPSRHFTELRKAHPELTDSNLVNSNNKTTFTGKADVVVAGAGIIGLCYAIRLKNIAPHLKIEVFEKCPAPVEKVGESALSPLTKFINTEIMPPDYLLRIFGLKDGLQYYCIDQQDTSVTPQDLGALDLSFQLDRRMSELFFTMWAQDLGINVYHGVDISFEKAEEDGFLAAIYQYAESIFNFIRKTPRSKPSFKTPRVILKDSSGVIGNKVSAKMVCDASGFSRRLTSKFGHKEKFDGFNCDSYWAYFKEKDTPNVESRLGHFDSPATKHMCFPEGWGWFIKLISWHHAPLCNLMDLAAYIIDCAKKKVPAEELPCTRDLSKTFDCPYEFIFSIGWAVRNDYKLPQNLDQYGANEAERKFFYFQRKYPALDRLMTGNFDLLPNYYENKSYYVRKSMAFRSPVVAGDGWLAVGNAAGFTNPLISPGINSSGVSSAFFAATLTEKVLGTPASDAKLVMQRSATTYQTYMHDFVMPRLYQMNRLWYNMFRDHRLFAALMRCQWTLGIGNIEERYNSDFYTARDLKFLVVAGSDDFQKFATEVLAVVAPTDGAPLTEQTVAKVVELSNQCMRRVVEKDPDNKWGRHLRHYDDQLQEKPEKLERDTGGFCWGVKCSGCKYWMMNYAKACQICGMKSASKAGDTMCASKDSKPMDAVKECDLVV